MQIDAAQVKGWLEATSEDESLEFKQARNNLDFEDLCRYCAAFSNTGGGRVILGVTDKHPRKAVGTRAFANPAKVREDLYEHLGLRVDVQEALYGGQRILVFGVPPCPPGRPIRHRDAYYTRIGQRTVPMPEAELRAMFSLGVTDFSAEACTHAEMADLSPDAIGVLRRRWSETSGNARLAQLSDRQLLQDAELLIDGVLVNAALILLGTRGALGRLRLAQAEVVFEFRADDASVTSDERRNYREGFFLYDELLRQQINLRNEVQQIREGLFRRDIPALSEVVVREALLNAIAHRDYQQQGSVFVRQYPKRLVIESPGGFPPGVTSDNVLYRCQPRNRRIAETLEKCGLVERSGPGVNLMYEQSISEGKACPDYSGTDQDCVRLTIWGHVQDEKFVRFVERIGNETQQSLATEDWLALDLIRRGQRVPKPLAGRLTRLRDRGLIEKTGRGRGTRYLLSRRYYEASGMQGSYTRRQGLDRETNKQLLLKHMANFARDGSRLAELMQVVPDLSRNQVQSLLRELKAEGRAEPIGRTRGARWFPINERIAQ